MFDAATSDLIRGAPPLPGLDVERLPERLTETYSRIISIRTRLREGASVETLRPEVAEDLRELRQLAHTYGAYSLVLDRDNPNRRPAAFVAATAHHLVALAAAAKLAESGSVERLSLEGIPSSLAAALLFIIAEHPADAHEATLRISLQSKGASAVLTQALRHLIRGELPAVLGQPEPDAIEGLNTGPLTYLEELAVAQQWLRLLAAVKLLARELSEGVTNETEPWREIVGAVIRSSVSTLPDILPGGPTLSTFPGPHHLAALLREAGLALSRSAVVGVPPPAGVPAASWTNYLARVARHRPFLWQNHRAAVSQGLLQPGISAVVTFPTGAGKSILAELKIVAMLLAGRNVVYLAPTRALVAQVESDLEGALDEQFGSGVVRGSLVSDSFYSEVEYLYARVAVMTPERCLTLIAVEPDIFEEVGLIIFDECHLLHGGEEYSPLSRRGLDAMLCLMRLATIPLQAPDFVLMSAMIANGKELASWLSTTLGVKTLTCDTTWKPTRQARGCVVYDASRVSRLRETIDREASSAKTTNPPSALQNRLRAVPLGIFCLKQTWATTEIADYVALPLLNEEIQLTAMGRRPYWRLTPNRNAVAAAIGTSFAASGAKTLVFAASPRDSFSIAKRAAEGRLAFERSDPLPLTEQESQLFQAATAEVGDRENVFSWIKDATACHHGLMLSSERRLVESLFRRPNGIQLLAATPTLAQGMNLPVEAVILAGDDRYDTQSDARELLQAHDLLNASGRAGRAGYLATGIVLMIPGEVVTVESSEEGTTLGGRWFALRERVFAQSDQCLVVIDPIERYLDRLHLAAPEDRKEVEYFLRRLPGADVGDDGPARDLLARSLGAYRARQNAAWSDYEARIQRALEARNSLSTPDEATGWEGKIASDMGIDLQLVRDLATATESVVNPMNTMQWVDWFIGWLQDDVARFYGLIDVFEVEDILKQRIGDRATTPRWHEAALKSMKDVLRLWMLGVSLVRIEDYLAPSGGQRMCYKARKLAIRLMPRISFAIGVVSIIVRRRSETVGKDRGSPMPLVLGTLAACTREGFDCPEKLALYFVFRRAGPTSRVLVHQMYSRIGQSQDLTGPTNETFAAMMERIERIIGDFPDEIG